MQTFLLVPTGFGVGLTSVSLGLLRALDQGGLKCGFYKPIAQHHPGDAGPERSTALVARVHKMLPPSPVPRERVEQLLGDDDLDDLMQECVQGFQQAAKDKDVVIVEGVVPTRHASYAAQLNIELAYSLDADIILVSTPEHESPQTLAQRLEFQAQPLGGLNHRKVAGLVLNKIRDEAFVDAFKDTAIFQHDNFHLVGQLPWQAELTAPRVSDIAKLTGAKVLHAGDMDKRRVQEVMLCARTAPNVIHRFFPGNLVVTPGDRDDIIMAASLAALNGMPLAGLLLCSNVQPDERVLDLCRGALQSGLPVLTIDTNSYATATQLDRMNREIPIDDDERAEAITRFVASHLDRDWLIEACGQPHESRLSPPAFRYQLVQRAKAANKRIVLPEGDEPRTIQAAAECHRLGIARCVLLANPDRVAEAARVLGITLPDSLEIIDPDAIRHDYVAPMVALREAKGLNAPMALAQLEDPVVLGTMMLAEADVDGLVSGAVHTTANTIRPALQLIKTAPQYRIVSSVFFMLLPEQVLVYGDCAVNPMPTAEQLAEIAVQSAASAEAFGITPRVAMISYSTGSSGTGAEVEKVRQATELARQQRPDLLIDGPLQYDAAAVASVGRQKAPDSKVAGRATIYVFPDLNTGNTTYKAVQRSTNCVSVGPMLQGLRKPVNDLSRGALVDDIVYTIALTAVQATQNA